jgi:hypothetical protein
MKFLLLVLVLTLAACNRADPPVVAVAPTVKTYGPDGCNVDISSRLVNQRRVGPITNLVKDEKADGFTNECTVTFDIAVDGKTYSVTETASGLEQMASMCYYARERAREDLLLDLGGDFKSESKIECRVHEKS